MIRDRIIYIDVARTLAVLWIVGFWHLRVYVGPSYCEDHSSFFGSNEITVFVLGLFMFLSGFFMAKYTFDNFRFDMQRFYLKRLRRFYLLYGLSAICLYLMGYNEDVSCLLTTLTMTSSYILPQPSTLWFFSMLASFYLITPFISRNTSCSSIIAMSLMFLLISIMHKFIMPNGIDFRFFWCFPSYCVGIIVGKHSKWMYILTSHKVALVSVTIVMCGLLVLYYHYNNFPHLQYALLPFGICLILYLSRMLSYVFCVSIIEKVAYCSMCAYLFHREIYIILMEIYNWFGIDYPYWFSLFVFLPICLLASYAIQFLYDKILQSALRQ